jgi:PhnB protein
MGTAKPIPDGYPSVTPYLPIDGAEAAIEFYTTVLGAKERMRMPAPGGKIGHAELELGDSLIMVSDAFPEMGHRTAKQLGGSPVSVAVYVEDVDAVFERAVAAGATVVRPVEDQFYGDRAGSFDDPWGHRWSVATHVEDVSPDEMARRSAEMMGGAGG